MVVSEKKQGGRIDLCEVPLYDGKAYHPQARRLVYYRANIGCYRRFQSLLSEKELSLKTVKDVLVVLRSVIAYTEKTTKVGLKNIEIIYPKENKKEMRVLSSEEQRRFAAFLMDEPDVFKIGILISLVTGLRIGEICALRWRDVSFRDKTIRIASTM